MLVVVGVCCGLWGAPSFAVLLEARTGRKVQYHKPALYAPGE